MKALLEIALLTLATSACLLMGYWAWQEWVQWRGGRHERRSRRQVVRSPGPE